MTRHEGKDQETNQSPSQPDPALAGRLCIKLKIPNSNMMILREEELKPVDNSRSGHRVCDICGKEFSSGKAWGGHKRHHLKVMKESLKKDHKLKNPAQSKRERCNTIKVGDVKIKGGKPVCCLCGKCFSSMNGLFGHMKFHSDRDWTGTQPPLLSNSASSSRYSSSIYSQEPMCVDAETRVDLLSLLAGWRKTDKRGKGSTCDPVYEAAMDLMKLSQDNRLWTQQLQFAQDCRFENPETTESDDDDDDDKGFLRQELAKKMKKKKAKKKKLNQCDDYDELIRPGGFKCNTCGSSFSTFQALGGHRSSSCIGKKPEETLQGSDDEEDEDGNLFQCEICNKSFSSGQALGGHKRIHWKPTPVLKTQINVAIKREDCYDNDAENEVYCGKLGFDLNEPYVLQDDD